MKKIIVLLLALAMCVALCACGKSETVTNVEGLISAVGEITIDSESAVSTAEDAYNALTAEEKAEVENYAVLTDARTALDEAIKVAEYEALKAFYVGEWVSELEGDKVFTLNADGTGEFTANQNGTLRNWLLNEDGTTLSVGDTLFSIITEGGYIKLVCTGTSYVRAEDYQDAFDTKFVKVELNADNVKEYLGEPVFAGHYVDEFGNINEVFKDMPLYLLTSEVYDDGLIYIASTDFAAELYFSKGTTTIITDPFMFIQGYFDDYPEGFTNQIKGTVYYVKDEYVVDNCLDIEVFSTYVTLTNGAKYFTGPFDTVDFSYDEFKR